MLNAGIVKRALEALAEIGAVEPIADELNPHPAVPPAKVQTPPRLVVAVHAPPLRDPYAARMRRVWESLCQPDYPSGVIPVAQGVCSVALHRTCRAAAGQDSTALGSARASCGIPRRLLGVGGVSQVGSGPLPKIRADAHTQRSGTAMKLTAEQTQRLFQEHGVWLTSACDKCGKVLSWLRYTIKGQKGEWCSLVCRDGVEAKVHGRCQSCNALLNGKRKGTRFCSDRCRKRDAKQNGLTDANYRGMAAHSKDVADGVEGLRYSRAPRAEMGPIAVEKA